MLRTITLPQTGIQDFPFFVEKKELESGFYEHDHDYVEINVIVRGSAVHTLNGRPSRVKTGDVFVLNPGSSHGFSEVEGLAMYQAMYDPVLLNACLPALKKMSGYHALFIIEPAIHSSGNMPQYYTPLPMKELEAAVMLFENMIREFDERKEGFQAVLQAQLIFLVTALSRNFSRGAGENPRAVGRVARAAAWMEANCLTEVTLGQMAKVAGCSACQLIRDFKRSYGATPLDYVLHLRIENAMLLLKNKAMSVTDIAYQSCFSDANYFSRLFRKHTGMSPSQYRNKF